MSMFANLELSITNIKLVYFDENSHMDVMKITLKADNLALSNLTKLNNSSKILQKKVHFSNISLSLEFLDQAETKATSNIPAEVSEKGHTEFEIISGFYCEAEIQASFADQIDVEGSIVVDEMFIRLPQRSLLYALLHLSGKSRGGAEGSRRLQLMSPLQRFQYIGTRVLKGFNFKRRAIERLLKKYREYKKSAYMDLYSRKLLQVGLSREDLNTLEKIEESSTLAEIMYLRNLVIERQMLSNMITGPRSSGGEPFFDKSNLD